MKNGKPVKFDKIRFLIMHEGAQFENVSYQKHIQKLRLEMITIHPPKVAHFFYDFFSKNY